MIRVLCVIVLLLLLQSCALLLGGATPENITVKNGFPKNAKVYYLNNKVGNAPMEVFIPKTSYIAKRNFIAIKAEGYQSQTIEISRRVRPFYFILDCIFLGIPLYIDYKTGKIWKPFPAKINYHLLPTATQ